MSFESSNNRPKAIKKYCFDRFVDCRFAFQKLPDSEKGAVGAVITKPSKFNTVLRKP